MPETILVEAITWNLFHGRDHPPDPALLTWRSRLLGISEWGATHVQVNRALLDRFADRLASADWSVALLQEAPPRWLRSLCLRTQAHGASALTSRNLGAALRAWIADRNPDLLASNEGGSNQLLVRPPWRIVEVRRLTLTVRPERRRMVWASLTGPSGQAIAVANLHASAGNDRAAAAEVLHAADTAVRWSGEAPLLFGGDLNVRPQDVPGVFRALRERHALGPPTAPGAIDHLLARHMEVVEPPRALTAEWREVEWREDARRARVRLSDHGPVAASFAPATGARSGPGRSSR